MSALSPAKLLRSPLVRILAGFLVTGAAVFAAEWSRTAIIEKIFTSDVIREAAASLLTISVAICAYMLLFRAYERRAISELHWSYRAFAGFFCGWGIQTIVLMFLYATGHYRVHLVNPVSYLLPGFFAALTAAVVVEILLRGIFFRLAEEMWGSYAALALTGMIFLIAHGTAKEATFLSVTTTVIQAGVLTSLIYAYSRNLWWPILFHFGWDLAEPGVYGGLNPGIGISQTLLDGQISGPDWLTGGAFGPGNSLPALIITTLASILFFIRASRDHQLLARGRKEDATRRDLPN